MSRLTHTFAAAGAAALLVVAAFSAGAAAAPAPQSAQAPALAPAVDPKPPDPDAKRSEGDVSTNAVLSPSAAEMQYVAITPCRVVDTRSGGGRFSNGTTRSYYVGGTFGFAPQGGTTGGCGIPEGAVAVAATVLALNPSGPGRIKAWPAGVAEPGANVLYYGSESLGAGTTLTLRPGAGTDLTVKNYNASTDVILDINGYYLPQMWAYISTSGAVLDQSGRLLSATNDSAGTYTLVWDRDVSVCVGTANSDISGYIASVYTSTNISYVYIDDNAGNASNYWFNVLISC
ncbi:hypothetical protein [Microbacterium sp. CFBP9034]|uniref:hypothetical protein n=1 Tax=Microbacterium sp. CFBP9034 TaxID=3096540 RepID=UPI002A6B7DD8|nr:hypothetical protein [Microbacterium sp. CFBP9034]MDY0909693.1 hypothetical protein [Microbacterium sp. CFBP9034]